MAPAPTLHTWRYLGALFAALAIAYAAIAVQGWTPKLGLDLQGGTQVILTPRVVGGGQINQDQLATSVNIIRQRVDAFGVGESEVTTQGNNIIISVPGRSNLVDTLGKTAQLRFRRVISAQPTGLPAQTATPAPSGSASPGPSGSAPPPGSPSAATNPSAAANPSAAVNPSAAANPTAQATAPATSPAPVGTAAPQPSGSAAGRAVSGALLAAGSPAPTQGVPSLLPASPGAQPPAQASAKPTAPAAPPAPTGPPTGSGPQGQVRTGDPGTAANFAALDCAQAASRGGIASTDKPDEQIVACSQDGTEKYLLDVARVVGTDVKGATASLQTSSRGGIPEWQVLVDFTGSGQSKFTKLTQETVNQRVAIVLDGVVVSAPTIQNVISSSAQITGSFTKETATDLANVLKFGALPLTFDRSQAQEISASLAGDQLHAGYIAGAIGLGLVILYSLLYYRGLGFVTIGSLVVAGAVTYAAVVLLGQQLDFRLSLAGIAGLIVSIGITADSFVVYFERIKDEVREGRSLRAAVDRGWVRARRTIISADFVQFLAAVIIYFLSVGAVRGFAFTLGLVTLIDIVVVFLFTRPLVSLFARSRTFSRPAITGLGRDRLVVPKEA